MEPAKIDWKNINSIFVEDALYEHINAPKWVDFSASQDSIDDEAWFCRPDCNHPKTVEDYLKETPISEVQRLAAVSEILPLGDRNRRDAPLKRRGLAQPSILSGKGSKSDRFVEDGENQNPNFSTPPSHQYKSVKAAFKSSTENKQAENSSQKTPRLKSTLSARNLFAGRDILNQITEFCNELKRLATRAKERENVEILNAKKSPAAPKKQVARECFGELGDREKERQPLLEVSKERREAMEKSSAKEKQRRKQRVDDTENIPISLDLKNIKGKEDESLSKIRTCPPSPQCFSAGRGITRATPIKASRSRLPERGILQELAQSNKEVHDEPVKDNKGNHSGITASIVPEREARTLDVFWFLKPCTLSS